VIVLLDSGPLGLVSNPDVTPASMECSLWLEHLTQSNRFIVVSEIVDYEVRRELLRARRRKSLAKLDAVGQRFTFAPITTPVMRLAAAYWANARQRGVATADDQALDADMILVAQARLLEEGWQQEVVIATTNVRHLARFATARYWPEVG
jgi:predicted nucleic acid-binding protein